MNKLSLIFSVILTQYLTSCSPSPAANESADTRSFTYWAWLTASGDQPDSLVIAQFERLAGGGIDAVLINTNTDAALLKRLVPFAQSAGLEVHAWLMSMNRPGDSIALQHPEWYAVSRDGKSCFDTRPYVGYYQWMCPTREASRGHVLGLVEDLAKVDGVASVHLDYIRYSDIYLPVGLLPKYDLVQNEELPKYDFCYCEACIAAFEESHHKNPLDLEHPANDIEWRQFRLNQVKKVVDDANQIAHRHGKQLTAAVFPYPEMAGRMVRQRWDKWAIDMVLPMVYHNFYNEELDWVGFATAQGISDLKGMDTQLHTGVFVPALPPVELQDAIVMVKENGANGIAFFDAKALTDEHLSIILETKNTLP